MEALLVEGKEILRDYRKELPPSAKVLELSGRINAVFSADRNLSAAVAQLPRELLLSVADLLRPPAVLASDEEDLEAEAILVRAQLQLHSPPLLDLATSLLPLLPDPTEPPSREELEFRAHLLLVLGRYASSALTVSTAEAHGRATALSAHLFPPSFLRLPLLRHLLSTTLPLYFKPHPKLNPSTGRVLSRPLGGDRGVQDWYEETEGDSTGWRKQAGLGGVVQLVIQALQPGEVEDLWPFLLPPLLSYLDDYEAKNRIVGVALLDVLLDRVDASLLRRTGVGKVLEKYLDSCLSTLSDPRTPSILAAAHPVALKLLNLSYPPISSAAPFPSLSSSSDEPRFTALCALLSTAILHTWEFKSGHVELETLTAHAIPPLVDALGSGTVRYLQVLVPHLCELLSQTASAAGGTWSMETVEMMGEAAVALEAVVRNGKLRIARWEGKIASATAQVWIGLKESDGALAMAKETEGRRSVDGLEEALKSLLTTLSELNGGDKPFVERLRSMDAVFEPLVAAVKVR